jgi:hypothetical protein
MVGTATKVRCSGGMPFSKSIRGNDCGLSSCVASQLAIPSPKCEAQTSAGTASSSRASQGASCCCDQRKKSSVAASVTNPIAER